MRLRPHRRNLVVWSQSASSAGRFGAPSFMRTRRIRRWIRTVALLTIIGLMPLARAVRGRWRTVLAGGVLTAVGVTMRDGPGGLVLLPGLWFLLTAPLVPATRKADRVRRPELERELALTAFSTPGQRRLAASALRAGATRGYHRGRDPTITNRYHLVRITAEGAKAPHQTAARL
jgi:hypothetical protein